MSVGLKLFNEKSGDSSWGRYARGHRLLLSPPNAWRILHRRTGGRVSRTTFYRWLDNGRIYSLRMGARMYIPWQVLEETIQKCLQGKPF